LADDGPDNRRFVSEVLTNAGAEVVTAENGQIAVEMMYKAKDEGRPFDIILMDLQMPVLDGYEATKVLRTHGFTGPIVALTASAMHTDGDKCRSIGCDAFAQKPINKENLVGLVNRYVDWERRRHDGLRSVAENAV
jgi:CheY-like chemotaxis protein